MRVPVRARAVLYLTIVEGASYSDAAAVVGCSDDAARALASRPLRDLRALAEDRDRTGGGIVTELRNLLEQAASSGAGGEADEVFARAHAQSNRIRTRRRLTRVAGSAALVVLLALGTFAVLRDRSPEPDVHVSSTPSTTTVPIPPSSSGRYQVDTTVLQDDSHAPELCLGGIRESLPPQCGGVPIANWDWSKVTGQETRGATTWGEFHVVGTYDGTTFRLTEPPSKPGASRGSPPLVRDSSTPCATPPGGWGVVDPAKITLEDYTALQPAIEAPADYAASWVDTKTAVAGGVLGPVYDVYNVQYTGDLERHRAELAQIWGGPICVSQGVRPYRELQAMVRDLDGALGKQLGLQVTSVIPLDREGQIIVDVVVANGDLQRAVDAVYGQGVVKLIPQLLQVPPG